MAITTKENHSSPTPGAEAEKSPKSEEDKSSVGEANDENIMENKCEDKPESSKDAAEDVSEQESSSDSANESADEDASKEAASDESKSGEAAEALPDEAYDEIFDAVLKRGEKEDKQDADKEAESDTDNDGNNANDEEQDEYDAQDEKQDEAQDKDADESEGENDADDGPEEEITPELRDLQTPTIDDDNEDFANMTPPRLSHRKPKVVKRRRSSDGKQPNQNKLLGKTKAKGRPKGPPSKKKKRLQHRDIEETGVWVQCMNRPCLKWRYLTHLTDPSEVPDVWKCDMNPDPDHNNCEAPEQNYEELQFVFNKFTEGSVVWAKMTGYPWWPAMVEIDPDYDLFVEMDEHNNPINYHVVFLDQNVSRSWLNASCVLKYEAGKVPREVMSFPKGKSAYINQISRAKARAMDAISLPIVERVKKYGFCQNFKGTIPDSQSQDSQVADAQDSTELEFLRKSNKRKAPDAANDKEPSNSQASSVDELLSQTEALLDEAEEVLATLNKSQQDPICNKAEEEKLSKKEKKLRKQQKREEKRRRKEAKRRLKELAKQEVEISKKGDKKNERKQAKEKAKLEKKELKAKEKEKRKMMKEMEKEDKEGVKVAEKEEKEKLKEQSSLEKQAQKDKMKEEKKKLKEKEKMEKKEQSKKEKEEKKLMEKLSKLDEKEEKDKSKKAEKEKEKEEKKKLKEQRKLEKKQAKEEKKANSEESSTSQSGKKRKLEEATDEKIKPAEKKMKKDAKAAEKSKKKDEKTAEKSNAKVKPSFKPPSKVVPTFGVSKSKGGFKPPVSSTTVKSNDGELSQDKEKKDAVPDQDGTEIFLSGKDGNKSEKKDVTEDKVTTEDKSNTEVEHDKKKVTAVDSSQSKKAKKPKFSIKRQSPRKDSDSKSQNLESKKEKEDKKTASTTATTKEETEKSKDEEAVSKDDKDLEGKTEDAKKNSSNDKNELEEDMNDKVSTDEQSTAVATGSEPRNDEDDKIENSQQSIDDDSEDFCMDMDWPGNPSNDLETDEVTPKPTKVIDNSQADSQPFDLQEE